MGRRKRPQKIKYTKQFEISKANKKKKQIKHRLKYPNDLKAK